MEVAVKHLVSAAVMALGVLAFGTSSASAYVACNDDGDCWRTKERYKYPPEAHVYVHPDTWKYQWHDEGAAPGYYSKGAWVNSPIQKELEESFQGPGEMTK
jgi:spore germination protein YaaH